MKVYTEPASERGALWLPYRREPEEIEESIAAGVGESPTVFCHADIKGAYMSSQSVISSMGVDLARNENIDWRKLKVFSGHYHYPGLHPKLKQICYVGSAYQVRANEADQLKRLLVLKVGKDNTWKVDEEIPVPETIAPRHFHISTPKELSRKLRDIREGKIIQGDRIIGSLPEGSEEVLEEAKEVFREHCVGCTVRVNKTEIVNTRINDADMLAPVDLLEQYAREKDMLTSALRKGREVLQLIPDAAEGAGKDKTVAFEDVELEGFGPFLDRTAYPFGSRGLTIIQGINNDDPYAASNGSGKSMLFSALFWVLFGKDPLGRGRHELQNSSSDRIWGRLRGSVNGTPFAVERRATASTSTLKFTLDGRDFSEGMVKTQEQINTALLNSPQGTKIASNFLLNCIYFARGEHNGLFEKTGKEKDDTFRLLFRLGVWETAKQKATEALKTTLGRIKMLEGEVDVTHSLLNEKGKSVALLKSLTERKKTPETKEIGENPEEQAPALSTKLDSLRSKEAELRKWLNSKAHWDLFAAAKRQTAGLKKTSQELGAEIRALEKRTPLRDLYSLLSDVEKDVWVGLRDKATAFEDVVGFIPLLGHFDSPSLASSFGTLLADLRGVVVCRTNTAATSLLDRYSEVIENDAKLSDGGNPFAVISLESISGRLTDLTGQRPAPLSSRGCIGYAVDLLRFPPGQERLTETLWGQLFGSTLVFETEKDLHAYLQGELGGRVQGPLVSLDGYSVSSLGVHRRQPETDPRYILAGEAAPSKEAISALKKQIKGLQDQQALWAQLDLRSTHLLVECGRLSGQEYLFLHSPAPSPNDPEKTLLKTLSEVMEGYPQSLDVDSCYQSLEKALATVEAEVKATNQLLTQMEVSVTFQKTFQKNMERAAEDTQKMVNAAVALEAEIASLGTRLTAVETELDGLAAEVEDWHTLETVFSRSEIEAYAREVGLAKRKTLILLFEPPPPHTHTHF